MADVFLTVDRDCLTGRVQISIESEEGHGYRIAGPKYSGSSKPIIRHRVTSRDVEEIGSYLRAAAGNGSEK